MKSILALLFACPLPLTPCPLPLAPCPLNSLTLFTFKKPFIRFYISIIAWRITSRVIQRALHPLAAFPLPFFRHCKPPLDNIAIVDGYDGGQKVLVSLGILDMVFTLKGWSTLRWWPSLGLPLRPPSSWPCTRQLPFYSYQQREYGVRTNNMSTTYFVYSSTP
ncbi:hypothetical protein F4813DRAFT_336385 [Daldinia decipiens]|uniref:uncharacterized protein n=1 Tax=Daldinia decipiens TaxID=326647 RepID=UPI0020C3F54F|nr:uncharacterized protein F4813DRAFT_336385 [Daldinia decipiens]KAI1659544.1 hypothetical protein F4813DRAFT_336385 [Daldinia decipiens]